MSEDPIALQEILHGSIVSIMQRVALDSRPHVPSNVLVYVATELGRVLVPRLATGAKLGILWRGRKISIGVEWRSRQEAPEILPPQAVATVAERFAVPPTEAKTYQPVDVAWWGANRRAVRIAPSSAPDDDALEIWQVGLAEAGEARWQWFVKYVAGLAELYHTVRGVLLARIGILREDLDARVQALRDARAVPLQTRLRGALDLLPRLEAIGAADLVEEVVTCVMLGVFGTGWRVRSVWHTGYTSTAGDENDVPGALVDGLVARVRFYATTVNPAVAGRLVALVGCFEAVTTPGNLLGPAADGSGGEVLSLLSMWTRVHELCRRVTQRRTPAAERDAEVGWASVAGASIPLLVRQLGAPLEEGKALDEARNWLVIWFCLELLNEERDHPIEDDDERREVRAELAYTLREALRYDLFAGRVDYFYDARTLVGALARLVAHHAVRVVGIPVAYHVAGLVKLIGGEGGANRYLAVEHLQHVADIYIAGQFLLSLQVDRAGAETGAPGAKLCTAGELLANGAPADVIAKFRCGFSLAALFHDVGHIMLPSDARLPERLLFEEAAVRELLQPQNDAALAAGRELTETCLDQLGLRETDEAPDHAPGAQRPTYFPRLDERASLRGSLQREAEKGRFSHGLLGAWYLHHVCAHAERLRHETPALREAREKAVRAILLHDVVTQVIDADADPIAALLVTSNEIFEWLPRSPTQSHPRALARPLSGPGTSAPAYRIDRSIEIRGLRLAPGGCGRRFDVIMTTRDGTWPDVAVELMPPEFLDGPVLRLWLAKAQAMGRIKPGSRSGFGPMLRIRSALYPDLLHCNLDTRGALKATLREHFLDLPELLEWCNVAARFRRRDPARDQGKPPTWDEEVRLRYLEKQIYWGDVHDRIAEIEQKVAAYLIEVERARAPTA